MPDFGTVTGTLTSPYPGAPITSGFGPRRAPVPGASTFHPGIDYGVGIGTPTRAMDGGRVIFAGPAGSAGNVVVIDHGNGAYSRYGHLSTINVRVGDPVEQGEDIARSGATGIGTGPHGHVEFRVGGGASGDFRGGPGSTARAMDFSGLVGGSYLDRVTLVAGDTGSGVVRLQEQLIEAGFGDGLGTSGPNGNGADGDYGDRTVAAVVAFQRAQGFPEADQDGKFGPQTRAALAAVVEQGSPTPVEPTPGPTPTPTPAPEPTGGTALDTPGPFAATTSSELLSTSPSAGRTAFSELTLGETRSVVRGVFGDSVGSELLSALGAANGDERIFLQRVTALARHEGAFGFGRENPDPARGFNVGTFQEGGGSVRSQAQSNAQFEARVQAGLAIAERTLGRAIDPSTLTVADRDVLAFVGWRQERSESVLPDLQAFARRNPGSTVAARMAPFAGTDFRGDPDQLFGILADPNLTREQVIEGTSYLTQGGVRAIGRSVEAWTTPGGAELFADLDAAATRGDEPDALRREPAFPTLRRGDDGPAVDALQGALVRLGYDLGASGPAGDGVDGDFGDRTRAAVQAFQRDAGFSDTRGVVGPQTWGAIAARDARTVPTEPTPPAEPAPPVVPGEPLGDRSPEEYTVRQFSEIIRDATWTEGADRVTMSGDAARWVADFETAGDPRVQLTFPGTYDRVSQGLTARPGSDVAAVLDAARAAENGIQVRTAVQNGSPGTYVLIDEAAILSRFPTVDAFVAAARADLAIQDAVETELADVERAQTPAEARAVLARNPAVAGYLGGTLATLEADLGRTMPTAQAADLTDTLYGLATNLGRQNPDGPYDVAIDATVVRDAATRGGADLTETQVDNAVVAMQMVRTVAETNPDAAEAVSTLRAEAAESRAPNAETPVRDEPAPIREAAARTETPSGDGADLGVTTEPILASV